MVKYLKRLENREQLRLETGSRKYSGRLVFTEGTEDNPNNKYEFHTKEGEIFTLTHHGPNRVRMIEGKLVQLTLD